MSNAEISDAHNSLVSSFTGRRKLATVVYVASNRDVNSVAASITVRQIGTVKHKGGSVKCEQAHQESSEAGYRSRPHMPEAAV